MPKKYMNRNANACIHVHQGVGCSGNFNPTEATDEGRLQKPLCVWLNGDSLYNGSKRANAAEIPSILDQK